jgi:asparagine synthase (glutamine-hydrolysing)
VCGIAGIVSARADAVPSREVLARMTARLTHRGPDDVGYHLQGPVALAMRRLKIIDLESGRQPMTGEDGSVWVVYNGEIYNYREEAEALQARGHRFRTRSDTEVIVHGFEEHGLAVLSRLEGMFALALWDEAARTLVLARDRFGIKPLYYAVLPQALVFASELRAILEHPGVSRAVDPVGLSLYLAHDLVPTPHSVLAAVRKLPAAHVLSYTEGRVKIEPYWELHYGGPALSEEEAAEQLRGTLETAVRQHLISDVPLGIFLSGGIDSSAVAAMAARHVDRRLRTFSVGFEDASFDERAYARRVAAVLGSEHHEEVLRPADALDIVARLPDLLDEPLGDASLIPTYLLSRFARQSITVALSGDGGDELFAGYPTYQAHRLARAYERVPAVAHAWLVRPLIERLPVSLGDLSLDFRLKRFVDGVRLDPVARHAVWMGSFTPDEQRDLLTPTAWARLPAPPSYSLYRQIAAQPSNASELDRLLYLDLRTYLGEGVLTKVDRASMACSLEVRVPFLDRRVVELAAAMPPALKLRGFTTKYILRRALGGLLPAEILGRRKKGFGIPLGRWFQHELGPLLDDTFAPARLRRGGLFRPEAVARLLAEHRAGRRDHRKKLYTLLAWELWAQRHQPV